MKKVLFILDNLEGGGAERVFVNIANGFADNGILVEFVLGKNQGIYLNILHPSIPIIEIGGTSLLKYISALPKILHQRHYTHIFTASHYPAAAAILSRRISGTHAKVYLTHHYSYPAFSKLSNWKGDLILKMIHRFITPSADKIIAVSKGSLQWLKTFSGRRLPQGITIYNPVFDDSLYTLAAAPVTFPIDTTGKTILLSIGRLAPQKDQLTLIKAFVILRQTQPNVVLFILGTGPLQNSLKDYIVQHQLSSCVFLPGFQDNPYNWLANCDLFILSSIFEGFGNVLVEAMALGKTVVSTDCPSGPAEILQDGALGYLCPVKNPPALAAAMIKGLSKPMDADLVKAASRQYSISAILQQYLDIL